MINVKSSGIEEKTNGMQWEREEGGVNRNKETGRWQNGGKQKEWRKEGRVMKGWNGDEEEDRDSGKGELREGGADEINDQLAQHI